MVGDEGFRDPPPPGADEPADPTGDAVGAEAPTAVSYGADGVTQVLRVPVKVAARGGMKEVDRVVFRRPTGADILAVGNPVIFDPGRAVITHDVARMPDMIFRLSGVTPATLAKMDPQDLVDCFWAITPFFIPRM